MNYCWAGDDHCQTILRPLSTDLDKVSLLSYDSVGTLLGTGYYEWVDDTNFVVEQIHGLYPGEYRVIITPVSGTDSQSGNISGGFVSGTLFCFGKSVERTIVVGGGLPAR